MYCGCAIVTLTHAHRYSIVAMLCFRLKRLDRNRLKNAANYEPDDKFNSYTVFLFYFIQHSAIIIENYIYGLTHAQ
jgi:hypothetical protein